MRVNPEIVLGNPNSDDRSVIWGSRPVHRLVVLRWFPSPFQKEAQALEIPRLQKNPRVPKYSLRVKIEMNSNDHRVLKITPHVSSNSLV